jgi:hypothetical protein
MEKMRQAFYKKSKTGGKNKSGQKNHTRGLTMKQMISNVEKSNNQYEDDYEDSSLSRPYSKTYNENKFKGFSKNKQEMLNDVLGIREVDHHNHQLESIKSDLNKYKQNDQFDDIERFEKFLQENANDDQEELYEDGEYEDEHYLNYSEPLPKKIEEMTMEERHKYLEEKKRRKKEKQEEEFKKTTSFKPKINKKSKNIDMRRTLGVKSDRAHRLHDMKRVLAYRERQLKEIVDTENFLKFGQEEIKNCTFTPQINKKSAAKEVLSIQERTKAFIERKKKKEEEARKIREMNEIKGCTFQPKILKRKRKANGD